MIRLCGLWSHRLFCIRNTRLYSVESIPKASMLATRYTKDHEWVQEGLHAGRVRIGITDYAQKALGDLVYVELPKIGAMIKKQDMIGVVESVKGASDVYAPVSGTVAAVNVQVVKRPSLINKSPEDEGWLCELDLAKSEETEQLLDEKEYKSFCQGTNAS